MTGAEFPYATLFFIQKALTCRNKSGPFVDVRPEFYCNNSFSAL